MGRYAPCAGDYLACEVHGPLKPRTQPYSSDVPELVWVCLGWDGEGRCHLAEHPVPEASRQRLLAGIKYWPGCLVLDSSQDNR